MYSDKVDMCVMNNGGLRSTLKKGEITKGMIFELMPFENELVILELDSNDYIQLLQYITKRGGEPFAGVKIIMDEKIKSCFAADDGAVLHYKDGTLYTAVTFYEGAGAYEVSLKNGKVHHENIKSIDIG